MANPFYAPKVLNKTYRKANNCHPVELKIFRYIIERVYSVSASNMAILTLFLHSIETEISNNKCIFNVIDVLKPMTSKSHHQNAY